LRRPEFRWGSAPAPAPAWGYWLLAVGVHSVLLFGWITGRTPDQVRFPRQLITLAPMEAEGPEVSLPALGRVTPASRGERTPPPAIWNPPPIEPRLADRPVEQLSPISGQRVRTPRLGPGLGDARLWVEPLPLPPRQLAAVLTRRSQQEIADSVVTAIIQAYIDSVARDPDVRSLQPPSWVAEVGGKKFGIDARHIYVAGLKIPTALLALLPLPGGHQRPIDHRIEAMAYDLRVAGARSATLDEFRREVRALRQRKEEERQFEENRRTAPLDTAVVRVVE
jgi:hypothetical protein